MITKTSTKQVKTVLDSNISMVYESKNVRAFNLKLKEGTFVAVQYLKNNKELEVYFSPYITLCRFHTGEFKAVQNCVNAYLEEHKKV